MLTFANLKSSGAIDIASLAPSGAGFKRLLNDATERLMRRGDWEGTVIPIEVCVTAGCVVWPRYVGQVRKLNVCNSPAPIHNEWYQFLPYQSGCRWTNALWQSSYGGGYAASMVSHGRSSVFQDLLGDRKVRAYCSTPLDNNKGVWIFGTDGNGQPLQTKGIGGWTAGVKLVLNASSYAETSMTIRHIDYVIKDETQGPVRLYGWNSTDSVLEGVAHYDGGETNPSYLKTGLAMVGCASGARRVKALVKLQFVPVKVDTDLVLIDNLAALKLMMMSIKAEDANQIDAKRAFEMDAVRELNLQLGDTNPDDQIPVDMGEIGHGYTNVGTQRCF